MRLSEGLTLPQNPLLDFNWLKSFRVLLAGSHKYTKMVNGPKARKFVCGRCEVYRWCEDFAGRSASDLTPSSVCDFCKLEQRFGEQLSKLEQKLKEEHRIQVELLTRRVDKLQEELESERLKNLKSGEEQVKNKKQEKETREKKNKNETNKKKRRRRRNRKKKKNAKEGVTEGNKKREKKKESTRQISRVETSAVVKLQAKKPGPAPSKAEGPAVTVVGDSMVRGIDKNLSRDFSRVTLKSLPGKGNGAIRSEVSRAKVGQDEMAVIAMSGNDLYLRRGKVGPTEAIVRDTMGAADDCGLKTKRRVVVGIVPRLRSSSLAYSKTIGINRRVADLCLPEGVLFVDPYFTFQGRRDLFRQDGVHFNERGKVMFSNMIRDACQRAQRIWPKTGRSTAVDRKVVEGVTYARVAKTGKVELPPEENKKREEKNKNENRKRGDKSGNGQD